MRTCLKQNKMTQQNKQTTTKKKLCLKTNWKLKVIIRFGCKKTSLEGKGTEKNSGRIIKILEKHSTNLHLQEKAVRARIASIERILTTNGPLKPDQMGELKNGKRKTEGVQSGLWGWLDAAAMCSTGTAEMGLEGEAAEVLRVRVTRVLI